MKVVALISGGKDSCFNMMKCVHFGHEIVALANLKPADDSVDELDSYMYQTVGHQIIVSYAECMGLPLFRRRLQGSSRYQKLSYRLTPGDEVEDMFILLNEVKRQIPSVEAVASGAIASDYQRLRVESVCSRLGLVSLAYLWKQDQSSLLHEMIANGILAITVKVAALGLDPAKHLGKDLASLDSYLHKLKELYGINVCGEGGEYETLTLDCPLFINYRIILDEFQIILHSSDSIAPVGVLHPLAFHLEKKIANSSSNGSDTIEETRGTGSVIEVHGDCSQTCDAASPVAQVNDLVKVAENKLHISKSHKDDTFSISCWLQDSDKLVSGLQDDLSAILSKIEARLLGYGYDWENVLYIHLYVADMKEFASANETYVKFIKQEKCPFGVPSRSTIELPLLQAGLGRAYIEVLVANDNTKRVLHVQSISSWAPSCIGPYSQATLYKNILHMAGQLGLDPPTMILCKGGVNGELTKALENSEAVATCFNCSISTSAMMFVIYCSARIPSSELPHVKDNLDARLAQIKLSERSSEALIPIFLYVLVPDLPKSALVEVKPILFSPEGIESASEITENPNCIKIPNYWDFQHENWHDDCVNKCVIHGVLCLVTLCITSEFSMKICPNSLKANSKGDHQTIVAEGEMKEVSRFCIYLLHRVAKENGFSWDDTMYLRLYVPTSLKVPIEALSRMFTEAFAELAAVDQRVKINDEPIFNFVPVLGAGASSTSMDNVITCELLARKR